MQGRLGESYACNQVERRDRRSVSEPRETTSRTRLAARGRKILLWCSTQVAMAQKKEEEEEVELEECRIGQNGGTVRNVKSRKESVKR